MYKGEIPEVAFDIKLNGKLLFDKGGEQAKFVEIDSPVCYRLLSGKQAKFPYLVMKHDNENQYTVKSEFAEKGYLFKLQDTWVYKHDRKILLMRKINAAAVEEKENIAADGIQFCLKFGIGPYRQDEKVKFYVPTLRYSSPAQEDENTSHVFMDDRMTCPTAGIYRCEDRIFLSLSRLSAPVYTSSPRRSKGQCVYLHKTDIGSLGYSVSVENGYSLEAYWPYYEGNKSAALNSSYDPISAYYPLDGSDFEIEFEYLLELQSEVDFSQGVYFQFKNMASLFKEKGHSVVQLPFTSEKSVEIRTNSLGKCYQEFPGGAGFMFHFDPRKGYGSAPSGFGTSFNKIPEETYTKILEYGFTGRQLNAAYTMAKIKGGEWFDKGEKVIDFFIANCVKENGWMFTLYDLAKKAPFYSLGDTTAPKIHYVSDSKIKGNYLRTMSEAAYDLVLNYEFYKENGKIRPVWLEKAVSFADFLVRSQNYDGSWYRTYSPQGFSADDLDNVKKPAHLKSATAIPILFLCELCKLLESAGTDTHKYRFAAEKAAEFVRKTFVECDHYQGGTLDNPNIVDKEASQYAMAAMFSMYTISGEKLYLDAAERAARIFVTWNYIWNAPTMPGTYLAEKNFKTKGFGAINSIWGGGVVDIYSLFHVKELNEIGLLTKDTFFCEMAQSILTGTEQILSNQWDSMGFMDSGMQPEGFGVCNQGADDGMIQKGDIWGSLGWIYSAGIFGAGRLINIF